MKVWFCNFLTKPLCFAPIKLYSIKLFWVCNWRCAKSSLISLQVISTHLELYTQLIIFWFVGFILCLCPFGYFPMRLDTRNMLQLCVFGRYIHCPLSINWAMIALPSDKHLLYSNCGFTLHSMLISRVQHSKKMIITCVF